MEVTGPNDAADWREANQMLLDALQASSRGPRRNGLFALWLTVRVALGPCAHPPFPDRMTRRRLAGLERRITSLTLPAPLRRALTAALQELRDAAPAPTPASAPETSARVLRQLVAPVSEALGPEPGEAVAKAARAARRRVT